MGVTRPLEGPLFFFPICLLFLVLCQRGQKIYIRPGVAPCLPPETRSACIPCPSRSREPETLPPPPPAPPKLSPLGLHFGHPPWLQVSHCAPTTTTTSSNHHTASSTNLDIPDVTVLVFGDRPPHFALAQREQATCPRSHSRAGAQLGPLAPPAQCPPGGSWRERSPFLAGCPITAPAGPGGPCSPSPAQWTAGSASPQPGALGCPQCVCGGCGTKEQEWRS